jgi:hypothetical protein
MIWNCGEKRLLERLDTPLKIQNYLDKIDYDPDDGTVSPRYVIKERKANCFEGAILAAAALEYHGKKPLIVDMMADNDYDHVISVYKLHNHWGAISKSNTSVLRYREPVYKNIRELMMSYFDLFINTNREKTLRSYSNPVNLKRFNKQEWHTTSEDLEFISDYLYTIRHHKIFDSKMKKRLTKANPILLEATLIGAIPEGMYEPE